MGGCDGAARAGWHYCLLVLDELVGDGLVFLR